jgi:hypothetical protein
MYMARKNPLCTINLGKCTNLLQIARPHYYIYYTLLYIIYLYNVIQCYILYIIYYILYIIYLQ